MDPLLDLNLIVCFRASQTWLARMSNTQSSFPHGGSSYAQEAGEYPVPDATS